RKESETSGMAVMEVSIPSGFVADDLVTRSNSENLKHADLFEANSNLVVVYFELLENVEECFEVYAFRVIYVKHMKPKAITVYDYNDNSKAATVFYTVAC
ncbi:CD109 antigen-like isoform X1, partial [Dinothrombium tinctorium]